MKKRAAMKFRVSTMSQKVDGTSLGTQEHRTREYAANTGYEVVETLVISEYHTGTDLNSPGMARLKQAATAGQFDVLLFHSFDRLYRPENVGDEWKALELMAFFNDNGVTIEFVDGSVPTDPRYAAVASIFAGMNSGDYRRKMIEATQRGRDARKAEGRFLGRPPFGFSKDTEMRLIVHEEQAPVVKKIYDLYDRDRMGLRRIQKELTGTVPAPAGGLVWHVERLRRILTEPVYWSGKHRSGVPAPPIVSEAQARRVHNRLSSNHRLKSGTKSVWPLQGRMRCACGGNWRCQSERPGRSEAQYYCANRYIHGPKVLRGEGRCTSPRLGKRELELMVFKGLFDAIQNPAHLATVLKASLTGMRARIESAASEIEPLQAAVADVEERLDTVYRARINGRLSEEELDAKEAALLNTKAELEDRLASIDPARISELEESNALLSNIDGLLGWAEAWIPFPADSPGGFKYFIDGGYAPKFDDPDVDGLAKLWALFPPDWWIDGVDRFDDAEWPQNMLTELLDRLHAKIVVHDGYLELEGVLPISIPLESENDSPLSLHASHVPRRLG